MGIVSRPAAVALAATLLTLTATGCGSSAPTSPALDLAVTVPVNGSTVVVPSVRVVGDVSANEAGARVGLRVRGHRVRVHRGGTFMARVHLHRGMNRIRVVAFARGYPRTFSMLTVRFRPGRPKPPPSLRAEVDAVCVMVNTRDWGTMANLNGAPNMKTVESLVANDQTAVRRLEQISAPPGKAGLYGEFVGSLKGTVSNEQAMISSIQTRSASSLRQSISGWEADFKQFQKLGAQLGSAQCLSY
jgi:hypothetical protein